MHSNFSWHVRVYYEDTDAGGIVYYANYLKYFERARTEWLRAKEINQQNLTDIHGTIFVVKSAAIEYHAPAQLDDELKVSVVVRRIGRASVHLTQEARRISERANGDRSVLLVSGEFKLGCVDAAILRPCAIPDEVALKIKIKQTVTT